MGTILAEIRRDEGCLIGWILLMFTVFLRVRIREK
jgi:hypothetical protein